jgi:hypothetical protein
MAKYRNRPVIVEATQWFANGDHPLDDVWRNYEDTGYKPNAPREGKIVRYYRYPGEPHNNACSQCGHPMKEHGWIDTIQGGYTVCPGDYIITEPDGKGYYPCKASVFNLKYELE